ncbi:hypothetical protein DEU34_1339 [Microbacterium sp. AG1240]|uniref:hypothetical protein n=1 Tax=Microbacterium sp. AG1240 TaxID=2183992 RepID=UPI000EAFBD1F|nr:hypothetical protein [Microbacterium sp. AG1240]RKT36813.1 hypothetical protein DEU34_1339 [Microbacterium sp. AG1240]
MDNLAVGAEHEAAHVVLYLELGYPIHSTELSDDGRGLTKSRDTAFEIDGLDYAAICMAGPVVEDRYSPTPMEERKADSARLKLRLDEVRRGGARHEFEELVDDPDQEPEDQDWWRANGRAYTIELLERQAGDIDVIHIGYIEAGYLLARTVLELRAHDHQIIAAALLRSRFLDADDIYALPLRDLPRQPWK